MVSQCILLLAGLGLVVFGADYLVDGASAIARRSGLSEFVIGLTIVGMGTSAPEMVVSFIGASQGNADIAMGNVVGSNIFNTLLILGITALLLPVPITPANRRWDIPVNILVTVLLLVLGLEQTILGVGTDGLSRLDGGILITLFLAYIILSLARRDPSQNGDSADAAKPVPLWLAFVMVAGGLIALIAGGKLFVNSATDIAHGLGWSDKFIAVTILAGGTSMPELATCVAAAVKKKGQLALGNIIGSNLFNILLILGGAALIHPLHFAGIGYVDLAALLMSAVVLLTAGVVGRKNEIDRLDGGLFVGLWAAYMAWLIVKL